MAKITNPYYEELAYIQSNGSQYINTDITGYTAFKLKFQLLNTGSNQYGIFGSRQSGSANRFGCMVYSGLFHFMIGSSNMWNASVDTSIHELDFNSTRLIADGVEYATPQDQSYGSSDFYLFAMNRNSNGRIPQRIWYFETYDENGNLTHNFVPARRKSDSAIGLYDTINNDFYGNNGTGTFSYKLLADVTVTPENSGTITGTGEYAVGSNVTLTAIPNSGYTFEKWINEDYRLMDAIASTGTQYIDTGVNCTSTIEFELECAFTSTSTKESIIGSTADYKESTIGIESGNLFYLRWGEGTSYTINADTNFHKFKLENNNLSMDDVVVTTKGNSYTNTSLNLFRNNYSSNYQYSNAKLKYCIIKDNGTIIRNFVPVMRERDLEVGLLDLVEMKFYANSGTGEFQAYEENPFVIKPIVLTDNPLTVSNITNSLILTAQFKKTANCRYKVNGTWKNAKMYIKQNGTWKPGTPKIKINGNWKEGG